MPGSKNIQAVAELKSKLEHAKAIFFADYHGLTVSQISNLRDKIRQQNGEFSVAKNTLLKLALKDKGLPRDLAEILRGPTAVLIATEDEMSPLKALVDFAKDAELPKLKAGIYEDRILTADELNQLAKLPSKSELHTKLVGILNGPIYGFVNVLGGNLRQLVYVLNAIRNTKSSENSEDSENQKTG